MTAVPEVIVHRVAAVVGGIAVDNAGHATPETIAATGFPVRRVVSSGEDLATLSARAARALGTLPPLGGVIAASFSSPMRFPALSVRVAAELGLPENIPAFDLQMACSAYPYALFVAGGIASRSHLPVLVIDGDVQSTLTDGGDAATAPLFSDAATATLVSADETSTSNFDFLTRHDDALTCSAAGPIAMDGMRVFRFVATEVTKFLRGFENDWDLFVPHQANMYMVRQLARSLKAEDRLIVAGPRYANPGSCSVALALAASNRHGRALIAGFGAGLSASAGIVRVAEDFTGIILDDVEKGGE